MDDLLKEFIERTTDGETKDGGRTWIFASAEHALLALEQLRAWEVGGGYLAFRTVLNNTEYTVRCVQRLNRLIVKKVAVKER